MAKVDIVLPFLPKGFNTVRKVDHADYDAVLLIAPNLDGVNGELEKLRSPLEEYAKLDKRAITGGQVSIISINKQVIPSGRLILSSTGPVNRSYDDIRRFSDAGSAGVKRAISAGVKNLLVVCPRHPAYPTAQLAALLGALQTAYVPLELREIDQNKCRKLESLGFYSTESENDHANLIRQAGAIEMGRTVARDIAGSDPERMTPARVVEYVENTFKKSATVKLEVMADQDKIRHEYPLVAAVNRAANTVPRHQARIIKLSYQGQGAVQETLLFVGKGVTIDTGGVDVKTGGAMVGMSRDKSGAAAVAGFFKVLEVLQPPNLKVLGTMSMVRNSIGSDGYTCDEILTARSGRRVRVVNTDAEGRMIMLDPLNEMRQLALNEVNPHLFTIATLTGHAVLTVGEGYSIAMDNGPAKKDSEAEKLREASETVGDMIDVSRLRREDYDFHRGLSEYEDLRQGGPLPSGRSTRGHQKPGAFLILGSALDENDIDSGKPLKYTHIDMAGGEGPEFPSVPWGAPVAALSARYITPRIV